MKWIEDGATLKKYVPNVLKEGVGETAFYDKVLPWIERAEQFVTDEILGGLDYSAESEPWSQVLDKHASKAVASMAMLTALPHIDLVITANGLGIVSNQNVAPASKERVERLKQALAEDRDQEIDAMLKMLYQKAEWKETEAGKHFTGTMFYTMSVVGPGCTYSRREEFAVDAWEVEQWLADEALTPAVMLRLRKACDSEMTIAERGLRQAARNYVRWALGDNSEYAKRNMLERMVQLIRENPESFPGWAESQQAEIWAPPVFENKKESGGYFF